MTTTVGEVYLFAYPALADNAGMSFMEPGTQRSVFGRYVHSEPDTIPGFEVGLTYVTNPRVIRVSGTNKHAVIKPAKDPLAELGGERMRVTWRDIDAIDARRKGVYSRVEVMLKSGVRAWTYVLDD